MMKQYQIATCKIEGSIGVIQLDNPPQNYLLSPVFIEQSKIEKLVESGIKGLLITGVGRHFSAGANMESMKEQVKELDDFSQQLKAGNALLNYIDALNIPVVAAISGVCFGAGLEIALAADIRICEEKVLFAFPEINHDLFPGMGGIGRLIELLGKSTAMEVTFKGDLVNAEQALAMHLVDGIKPKGEALPYAKDLLEKMTANRPLRVINAVMQSVHNYKALSTEEAINKDVQLFGELAKEAFLKIKED